MGGDFCSPEDLTETGSVLWLARKRRAGPWDSLLVVAFPACVQLAAMSYLDLSSRKFLAELNIVTCDCLLRRSCVRGRLSPKFTRLPICFSRCGYIRLLSRDREESNLIRQGSFFTPAYFSNARWIRDGSAESGTWNDLRTF